jgi:stearoyl-CoA desaturase (delta-9 desaturase)
MRHHQYSDGQHDPHSPRNYSSIWSMMMDTYKTYHKTILESQTTNNPEYLKIPAWPKLDSYAQSRLNVFMWICIYIGVYYILSIPFYLYPMIALHSLVGPIQGAIVNWYGHKKGYQNYDNHDDSKNTLPIDLALMGELYQNNHHQNGKRLNFAHQWFEIDVTYHIARVLNFFKIIKI